MASYLATAAIGRFRIDRRTSRDGIRVLDAVDPRTPSAARRSLQKEERTVRFMSNQFGAYPFDDLGGVVDRTHSDMPSRRRPGPCTTLASSPVA